MWLIWNELTQDSVVEAMLSFVRLRKCCITNCAVMNGKTVVFITCR